MINWCSESEKTKTS